MCSGYLADQIEGEFGNGRNWGVSIEYSKEAQPLGTAGALKLAEKYLQDTREFLVMNGDSFLEMDLSRLLEFHRAHGGVATMAVVPVANAGRYGTVQVDVHQRVPEFREKTGDDSPGLINAGIYVFGPALLKHIPPGQVSLEREVFPKFLGQIYALEQNGLFIDIGTPADYERAQQLFERLDQAVAPASRH